MAYQTSQGLASLGRNGDSVLVHMNPTEVAGLQSLAMAQGGSLTINPHTGLPEAFSLGGFFKSLLPMAVGAMTGGAGMPLWAGIAAGAATGAVTNKENPLMGAAMGGLGGYGGFGLGQGLFAAGAPSAIPSAAGSSGIVGSTGEMGSSLLNASRGIAPGAASATANAAGNAYNLADTAVNTSGLAAGNVNPALTNIANTANTSGFVGSAGSGASGIDKSFLGGMDRIGPGVNQMGTGIKNIATGQDGAWNAFKNSFVEPGGKPLSDIAGYGKIAMPIGGAALGGLEPSDLYGDPINMDEAKNKQAYDPNSRLNLSGDTGLRLYADGGAVQPTIQSGGIRDLYGSSDNQTEPLSADGFGLGRLNNLASAQEMQQAKTLGYAMGGPVSFADGGDANLNVDSQPTLNLNTGTSIPRDEYYDFYSKHPVLHNAANMIFTQNNVSPLGRKIINTVFTKGNWSPNLPEGFAMGGPVSFADGGDSNKEDALGLPSLSPDTNIVDAGQIGLGQGFNPAMLQSVMGAMQPMQGMQGNTSMTQGQMPDQSNDSLIAKVTANLKADPNYQPTNPIEASIVKQIKGTDPMQQGQPSQQGLGSITPSQPTAPSYNPSVAMSPTYFAGINAPRGMARGGYLNGQGDGMSDSIPATIEGKQPARLADGEFVVPADVVSHIGNGSSKAGSQRLYSMLDKVRKARTGHTKQGKQINPSKYMPA